MHKISRTGKRADFDILVATTKADPDSGANTWTKVYTHKGDPISETTEFTFKDVEARWLRSPYSRRRWRAC